VKLSADDLAYLKKHGKSGIYCLALKDSVWQAQLEADGDPETSKAYPKVYIGQSGASVGIKRRITDHRRELRKGNHHNAHLQSAWLSYGEGAFECFVIATCADGELNRVEEQFIWMFNAHGNHGYNIASDASAPNRGRKFGDETKARMSEAHTGKRHSDETKTRMSDNNAMKRPEVIAKLRGENNHFFGKKHTPESRQKMSATRRANKARKRIENMMREYAPTFAANNAACE